MVHVQQRLHGSGRVRIVVTVASGCTAKRRGCGGGASGNSNT